ncbi:hypothetical protein F5148DRAFT_1182591 [Russula earlei]|uniref:Uncharacterized protein n=1 Tax=Russula earlei TaxID=71964 RepID=A0ACC0UF35_9AGAM|nr:hypothetical protein F5148DRAFT_1182591 [Russula earlei]
MSFLTQLIERLPDSIERAEDTIVGILNPNRKHETPEEKLNDDIRSEIISSHRFQSFAGEREQNFVKWHIAGHDYFYALSEMLDSARESIFIQDWWLTPELYLRRPPAYHPEWRFDKVLQRKAQQGVKIYVMVYNEITPTMHMSSSHTQKALEALHPNIACMRHPDHLGSKDDVEFWSHHEKVIVVDNHRACIGGLDICFGRWDTQNHPLADVHLTDFSRTLFPGQDYNNARVMDFRDVSDYVSETISMLETPRMPWQDVHMTIDGPVVLDIVQHFVERWNFIKGLKVSTHLPPVRSGAHSSVPYRYDWLAFPHNVAAAPNEAIVRHPYREQWNDNGRQFRQRFHCLPGDRDYAHENDDEFFSKAPHGTCRVQVVRSVSRWSHGVATEHSIQNAYIQMIREASHFIYIGPLQRIQFFISNTQQSGPVRNQIAAALVERIVRAARSGKKFKVIVVIPELPGFAGDVKNESSLKTIMGAQYRTINRGGSSIFEEIRRQGFEPNDYIRFYHLRVYDRINAPMNTLIAEIEANSGVKFNEAQVALARQWIGDSADPNAPSEVEIKVPEPTSEGFLLSEKTEVKTQKYRMPRLYSDAVAVIERFESGASVLVGRQHDAVADTVGQHALQDKTDLADEQWLGSEEEELNSYVSELSYIHTKLMIVDDRRVIMGSANLNDRSQRGDGDSEIALVVEDEDYIPSMMEGRQYSASRFAASLRRKLFRRTEPVTSFMRPAPVPNEDETDLEDDARVVDPLSDGLLNLLDTTARVNREVFTELFRPVPTNLVHNWKEYDVSWRRCSYDESQDFLSDDKELVEGPEWSKLNLTLPIYI